MRCARNRKYVNARSVVWAGKHRAEIAARIKRWRNTPKGRQLKRAAQKRYLATIRERQNKHNREHYARKKANDPAWYAMVIKRAREVYGPRYRAKKANRLRP